MSRVGLEGIGFLVRMGIGALFAIAILAWIPAIGAAALEATVASFHPLVTLLPGRPALDGVLLLWPDRSMEIIQECTSLLPTLLVCCAILAVPSSAPHKALGIAGVGIALWAFNLARLFGAAATIYLAPQWFEFVHAVVWQGATLAVTLGIFVLWLRYAERAS